MAKSILSALIRASRAAAREAERQQRTAVRNHNASIRRAEQARKAEERAAIQASKAAEVDRKRLEKEVKAAHIVTMEAKAEAKNLDLASIYDDIDNLLAATLGVDDHVDLESLRRAAKAEHFDRKDLLRRTPPLKLVPLPEEPLLVLPDPPKVFFARKKKHEEAIKSAEIAHAKACASWKLETSRVQALRKAAAKKYAQDERNRLAELEKEKARFIKEIQQHNKALDALITNLSYGAPEAVQEYISIVISNSVYPDHFPVEHTFNFEPTTAELSMKVMVPPPSDFPTTKAYKYVKSSDEITATQMSQRDSKSRYAGAVHQVAIRTLHEVFEADRRNIIKAISLEVGTETNDPATGKTTFLPFLAVAASRDAFMEFDLSGIVPAATLKHLGAAVSKDPFGLVAIDTTGVRRS